MSTATETTDQDKIESADGGILISISRVLQLLARPELSKWRPMMAFAVLLTLAAAVLEVVSPLLIGHAINQVDEAIGGSAAAFTSAVLFIVLGIVIRFSAAGLPQVRDWLFSPVSQDAQRIACVDAFGHAQSLSLGFHQTRRTGALNRVIERGASAIDYLIRFLAFNIGPTFVRLILASVALGVAFDYRLSLIAIGAVILYVIATVIITEWRVRQRRRMNIADTRFRGIAVDILTNFETVKSFAAEDRETNRFSEAMRNYNLRYVDAVRSMYVLNFVQALIMNLGLLGVLTLSAWNVVEGRMEIGDLTATMLMLLTLYAPLNILGWAWREIKQGAVDLEKLYGLLGMIPEVADKPDAKILASPRGEVVFDQVSFTHDARAVGVKDVSFDLTEGKKIAFVGTSGAGKSTALAVLEDLGWETIDNFPIRLLEGLVTPGAQRTGGPLAIGFDSRTRGFVPGEIIGLVKDLAKRRDLAITFMLLDCAGGEEAPERARPPRENTAGAPPPRL